MIERIIQTVQRKVFDQVQEPAQEEPSGYKQRFSDEEIRANAPVVSFRQSLNESLDMVTDKIKSWLETDHDYDPLSEDAVQWGAFSNARGGYSAAAGLALFALPQVPSVVHSAEQQLHENEGLKQRLSNYQGDESDAYLKLSNREFVLSVTEPLLLNGIVSDTTRFTLDDEFYRVFEGNDRAIRMIEAANKNLDSHDTFRLYLRGKMRTQETGQFAEQQTAVERYVDVVDPGTLLGALGFGGDLKRLFTNWEHASTILVDGSGQELDESNTAVVTREQLAYLEELPINYELSILDRYSPREDVAIQIPFSGLVGESDAQKDPEVKALYNDFVWNQFGRPAVMAHRDVEIVYDALELGKITKDRLPSRDELKGNETIFIDYNATSDLLSLIVKSGNQFRTAEGDYQNDYGAVFSFKVGDKIGAAKKAIIEKASSASEGSFADVDQDVPPPEFNPYEVTFNKFRSGQTRPIPNYQGHVAEASSILEEMGPLFGPVDDRGTNVLLSKFYESVAHYASWVGINQENSKANIKQLRTDIADIKNALGDPALSKLNEAQYGSFVKIADRMDAILADERSTIDGAIEAELDAMEFGNLASLDALQPETSVDYLLSHLTPGSFDVWTPTGLAQEKVNAIRQKGLDILVLDSKIVIPGGPLAEDAEEGAAVYTIATDADGSRYILKGGKMTQSALENLGKYSAFDIKLFGEGKHISQDIAPNLNTQTTFHDLYNSLRGDGRYIIKGMDKAGAEVFADVLVDPATFVVKSVEMRYDLTGIPTDIDVQSQANEKALTELRGEHQKEVSALQGQIGTFQTRLDSLKEVPTGIDTTSSEYKLLVASMEDLASNLGLVIADIDSIETKMGGLPTLNLLNYWTARMGEFESRIDSLVSASTDSVTSLLTDTRDKLEISRGNEQYWKKKATRYIQLSAGGGHQGVYAANVNLIWRAQDANETPQHGWRDDIVLGAHIAALTGGRPETTEQPPLPNGQVIHYVPSSHSKTLTLYAGKEFQLGEHGLVAALAYGHALNQNDARTITYNRDGTEISNVPSTATEGKGPWGVYVGPNLKIDAFLGIKSVQPYFIISNGEKGAGITLSFGK